VTGRIDNWGWKARIGMFIVGSEAVPEAEWWAMAPPHVSIHAARVSAKAPWARWREDRCGVELDESLEHGARQFASMRLSAVVVGHSSSSILGGLGWDDAIVENLKGLVGPDVHVTTNGLDSLAALGASGARRPFLVLPPWLDEEVASAAVHYYEDHGIKPAGYMRYDPGRKWRDLSPNVLYEQGLGFEQEVEPLYAQVKASCPDSADAVLIAGTGFRCVGILEALEQDLKRPVLSANQVSLWRCLRLSNVHSLIPGYGNLFNL
jgi:maleate isomerase